MELEDMVKQLSTEQRETFKELFQFVTNGNGTATGQLEKPADGIGAWLDKLRGEGYSPGTIRSYHYIVRKYLAEDPKPTPQSIRAFLARRLEVDKVSATAVKNDQKALKSLFTFLYDEGLWGNNPMARIKPIKIPKKEREPATTEQVEALLRGDYTLRTRVSKKVAATDRDKAKYKQRTRETTARFKAMMHILCNTGFRVTEAASILRDNVKFKPPQIKVMGKGGKERVVPISIEAACYIAFWIDASKHIDSPYLFPGVDPQRHWDVSSIQENMHRVCTKLGIPPVTPHMIRHWFATSMLRNGAKLEVVSRLLGHARLDTTGVYRHVLSDEIQEEYNKHRPV